MRREIAAGQPTRVPTSALADEVPALPNGRVIEAWMAADRQDKENHDASLELPETKAALAQDMPMLTGEFTRQELTLVGGLGV